MPAHVLAVTYCYFSQYKRNVNAASCCFMFEAWFNCRTPCFEQIKYDTQERIK